MVTAATAATTAGVAGAGAGGASFSSFIPAIAGAGGGVLGGLFGGGGKGGGGGSDFSASNAVLDWPLFAFLSDQTKAAADINVVSGREADRRRQIDAGFVLPLRKALSTLIQSIFSGDFATQPGAVPFINRGREDTRIANARALRETEDRLASTRLAGTPFGENIRSNVIQQGALAESSVVTNLAKAILQLAPNLFASTEGSAISPNISIPLSQPATLGSAPATAVPNESGNFANTSTALLNFARIGQIAAGSTS